MTSVHHVLGNNLYENNVASKLRKYYYRFGLKQGTINLVKRILVKIPNRILYYQEILIFEKLLSETRSHVRPKIEINVGLLTTQDIEKVRIQGMYGDGETPEKRIQKGYYCFIAEHKGDICFCVWVAPGDGAVKFRSKRFILEKTKAIFVMLTHFLTIEEIISLPLCTVI